MAARRLVAGRLIQKNRAAGLVYRLGVVDGSAIVILDRGAVADAGTSAALLADAAALEAYLTAGSKG